MRPGIGPATSGVVTVCDLFGVCLNCVSVKVFLYVYLRFSMTYHKLILERLVSRLQKKTFWHILNYGVS